MNRKRSLIIIRFLRGKRGKPSFQFYFRIITNKPVSDSAVVFRVFLGSKIILQDSHMKVIVNANY
jgi:hypothetical protein